MSEIDSSEDEESDVEEYVTLAHKAFTDELASSEDTVLSLTTSAPFSSESDNISPKSSVVADTSCTDFSKDCDVDIPTSSSSSQAGHVKNVLKSSKSKCRQFSSSLQSGVDTNSLYFQKLTSTQLTNFKDTNDMQNKSLSKTTESRPLCQQSRRQLKKQRRTERETTKGRGWYNMRMAEMTEEKKNDLVVIQMRKVLDPKRFYKGPDIRGALPKYVQTGTIVESKADFYSSRIPKKHRKTSLVDELLADAEFRRYNKRKYAEIQATQPQHRRSKAFKQMKRLKRKKK